MKLLLFSIALITFCLPASLRAEQEFKGLLRVNTTIQTYNVAQPWELNPPQRRRGLGALLPDHKVLTTAEMAANSAYLEFESADGTHTTPATVLAIDYEANLALLAPEEGSEASWLDDVVALETNGPVGIGDEVDIWQLEDNGTAIRTVGSVRSVDLLSTFASGHFFLAYEVKASMQSASSSYTLPVTLDGKLLGILTSYDSKDQICDVIAPEVITLFLRDLADGTYEGFPSLGIATVLTEDPNFRNFLGLQDDHGGLYISRILGGSAAEQGGLQKGDVLLAIDGHAIDRRGYYEHDRYGRLFWSHLIRGSKKIGDTISLRILRDGEEMTIEARLSRPVEQLIPTQMYDQAPSYLIKGGLVFQELSQTYLEAFGKEWQTRAPLDLLDALNNPEDYEEGRRRLVFLSRVVATPATIGYDRVANLIVEEVNGKKIEDMASLVAAFQEPQDGLHSIRVNDIPYVLYLDAKLSDFVDKRLIESGLPSLQRLP